MRVTNKKNCYCHTCDKDFHYLGISRHRASHREKKEDCKITFTHGNTFIWNYSNPKNKHWIGDKAYFSNYETKERDR